MTISIKRTFFFLSLTAALLIIAGWSVEYYASMFKPEEFQTKDCHGIIRMFQLDGEANIPTWFQSIGLLVCSFLLAAARSDNEESRFRRHWGTLSFIFLLLSLDEAACIHEGVGNVLSHLLHTSGIFAYAWVIPGGLFALVVLVLYLKFLRHLPARSRRDFLIAGTIYVSGTLGWEMVGGWYDTIHGSKNLTYMTLTVVEEGFESAGIVLFIRALLMYINEFPAKRDQHSFIASSSRRHPLVDLFVQD